MIKDDKLIQGIFAGLVGSFVKDILTALMVFYQLYPSFWDYGEYWIYAEINISILTKLQGILAEVFLGIALGILYAHTKNLIQTKHPLLRGFIFGLSIWFIIRGFLTISQIESLTVKTPIVFMFNTLIAGLYGLSISYVLERFERQNS